MGIKVAITGKGGVGKTTVAALIARGMAHRGRRVIAVDADPVTNLGAALGIPEENLPTPISEMKELIAERTGASPGVFGSYFKLNPKVDDIPDTYCTEKNGVRLLVMGSVERGGSGCVCPENALLRTLLQHLLLEKDEVVIMDMEAGVEHLGRATARAVNLMIVVVDMGARSHFAARKIRRLASDLHVASVKALGNRLQNSEDEEFLRRTLGEFEFVGFLPQDEAIAEADRRRTHPYPDITLAPPQLWSIVDNISTHK